jgi:hypothetical protein
MGEDREGEGKNEESAKKIDVCHSRTGQVAPKELKNRCSLRIIFEQMAHSTHWMAMCSAIEVSGQRM